ncbi:MAG: histone deacetylase, partial [Chloroflexota bacterium]
MAKLIYHPNYNIGFLGLENLHPFDSKKYGRAYQALEATFGKQLATNLLIPNHPVTKNELLTIHSQMYLDQLRAPGYASQVLEVPLLKYLPSWVIDNYVLEPMRWATQGSILAAEAALTSGLAINLSGGYHHAKTDKGEGFCAYSDIALAVHFVRQGGLLSPEDRIVYIDLDAHQGNGVCHCFLNDPSLHIFDIYNENIYPAYDTVA